MRTYRHDVYVLRHIETNNHIPNSIYLYEYVTSFFSEFEQFNISNYIYRDNGYRNKTKEESIAARESKAKRAQRREIKFREARQLQLTQCIPR